MGVLAKIIFAHLTTGSTLQFFRNSCTTLLRKSLCRHFSTALSVIVLLVLISLLLYMDLKTEYPFLLFDPSNHLIPYSGPWCVGKKLMQIGGLTLNKARIDEGRIHNPSPHIIPEATAGTIKVAFLLLSLCHT